MSLRVSVWFGCDAIPAFAQTPAPANTPGDRSAAYYDFAMAHLYDELAGAYGNRGEYVNKAIDFYRQAMKADPSASYIAEELSEFYVKTGNLEKATQEANNLLKADPANNDARKILARIYSRQIGDPDQGKVDQAMLKNAIEQYLKITQQDPKDSESLSMLARLYRVSHDEAAAEKAYRQVLALDPKRRRCAQRLGHGLCGSRRSAQCDRHAQAGHREEPGPAHGRNAGEFLRTDQRLFACRRHHEAGAGAHQRQRPRAPRAGSRSLRGGALRRSPGGVQGTGYRRSEECAFAASDRRNSREEA